MVDDFPQKKTHGGSQETVAAADIKKVRGKDQWEISRIRKTLEVPIPYMFGLFFRPKFQGISPENMAKHMVRLRTSILGSWNSHIKEEFWSLVMWFFFCLEMAGWCRLWVDESSNGMAFIILIYVIFISMNLSINNAVYLWLYNLSIHYYYIYVYYCGVYHSYSLVSIVYHQRQQEFFNDESTGMTPEKLHAISVVE